MRKIGVLNVRGSDISFNPVVISYLIISKDTLFWFVDKAKVNAEDPEFKSHFQSIPIEIHEYSEFFPFLDKFVANLPENHVRFLRFSHFTAKMKEIYY